MTVGLPPISRTLSQCYATVAERGGRTPLPSNLQRAWSIPRLRRFSSHAGAPVQLSKRDATVAFWRVSAAVDRHRHRGWSSERDGAAAEGRSRKIDAQRVIVMRKRRTSQKPRRTAEWSSSVLDDRASLPNEGLFAPSRGTSSPVPISARRRRGPRTSLCPCAIPSGLACPLVSPTHLSRHSRRVPFFTTPPIPLLCVHSTVVSSPPSSPKAFVLPLLSLFSRSFSVLTTPRQALPLHF